jgi:rRNA maturation endonuclease Nob1
MNKKTDTRLMGLVVSEEEAAKRFAICSGCDRLFKPTATCKECGCFMKVKTKLEKASCPIGKW